MNYPNFSKNAILFSLVVAFQFCFINPITAQMRQVYIDDNSDNAVKKLSFVSPSEGYVAFHSWIGYTQDSGRTFAKKFITLNNVDYNGYSVNLTFGFSINGVKAFDKNTILVYGDYGFVPAMLYSTNGGNNFKLIYHSQNTFVPEGGIADVIFPQNNGTGYAVDPNRILKTIDNGITWSEIKMTYGSGFTNLEAVDNATIFAMSSGVYTSKLLKSTNGGQNWQDVALPIAEWNFILRTLPQCEYRLAGYAEWQ